MTRAPKARCRRVIDLISRVRNIRSEMNIKPGDRVHVLVGSPDEKLRDVFTANREQIARLARASEVASVSDSRCAARVGAGGAGGGAEVAVPLEGLIDFAQERERLGASSEKLQKEAAKLEAQLAQPAVCGTRARRKGQRNCGERLADIAQRTSALQQMVEALK